jgi:hypothetical protein
MRSTSNVAITEGKRADRSRLFGSLFNLDILPGDYSLIESHISYVMNKARMSFKEQPELDSEERRIMIDIPVVLFKLVVLRVYLGRSSEDDFQIYYLARSFDKKELASIGANDPFAAAKHGRIVRYPTIPEQVLLAAEGVKSTRTAPTRSPMGCNLKTKTNKSSGSIPDNYLLASALDANNSLYLWEESSAPGLFRGPTVVIPAGRPKPRPKWPGTAQASDPNVPAMLADLPNSLKRGRDKNQGFGDSADEMDADSDADMDDEELAPVQQDVRDSRHGREKRVRFNGSD